MKSLVVWKANANRLVVGVANDLDNVRLESHTRTKFSQGFFATRRQICRTSFKQDLFLHDMCRNPTRRDAFLYRKILCIDCYSSFAVDYAKCYVLLSSTLRRYPHRNCRLSSRNVLLSSVDISREVIEASDLRSKSRSCRRGFFRQVALKQDLAAHLVQVARHLAMDPIVKTQSLASNQCYQLAAEK